MTPEPESGKLLCEPLHGPDLQKGPVDSLHVLDLNCDMRHRLQNVWADYLCDFGDAVEVSDGEWHLGDLMKCFGCDEAAHEENAWGAQAEIWVSIAFGLVHVGIRVVGKESGDAI